MENVPCVLLLSEVFYKLLLHIVGLQHCLSLCFLIDHLFIIESGVLKTHSVVEFFMFPWSGAHIFFFYHCCVFLID